MEKQENSHKVRFSKIACLIILVVLVCVVPCRALVNSDKTLNIDYGVNYLAVYDMWTANLYPGAEIYAGIYAGPGSTINFYGGQMYGESYITAFSSSKNPKITVHGRNFAVNDKPLGPSETSFTLDFSRPYHTLTGFYGNGDEINLRFRGNISISLVVLESQMTIDVKPGDDQNNINLKSNGVVPVAVLTTEEFDAAMVNPATALFAGAAPDHWSSEDVDGDGDDDIIFHFRTQQLDLNEDSTEATLTAQTVQSAGPMTIQSTAQVSGGSIVSGTDTVRIVTAKKSKK